MNASHLASRILRGASAACLAAGILAFGVAPSAHAVSINFDSFGPLPQATFGGQGIPNDEVAASSTIVDGANTLTVALSATQRFSNPPLTSDGAGTFFATPGSNFGGMMQSGTEGALWNFNFYVDIQGPGVLADYEINILYDTDPAADNTAGDLGVINLTNSLVFGMPPNPTATLVETSQNLLFGFLATSIPGFIDAPSVAFDPNVNGEYTFAIAVSESGFPLETVAMKVQVIPEPATIALVGLAGLAALSRRRG